MKSLNKFTLAFIIFMTACSYLPNMATPAPIAPPLSEPAPAPNTAIPQFNHVVLIVFENKEYDSVIGNSDAPVINQLAVDNTLLASFYAPTHPSLPNYVALIGGDTYGYTTNCIYCPVKATNLADLIEANGRSWITYQEGMSKDCAVSGTQGQYAAKHNPFLYFNSILYDRKRCADHVEELSSLPDDEANGNLANFIFITPNLCNSGHDCGIKESDTWVKEKLPPLQDSLQQQGSDYLIVLTWDEGETNKSCCGLPAEAGGHIATILISPHAKKNFIDDTPYPSYSLLRTISEDWGLPLLGHAADDQTSLILAPWQ